LHSGQIGMAGAGSGQRFITRQTFKFGWVNRVNRHHLLPFWPLRITDLDGNGATQCDAVPNAGTNANLILFELHPSTSAITQPAPRELLSDLSGGDFDSSGKTFGKGYQSRTM